MVESAVPNPGTQRNELAGQVDAVAIARPPSGELRVVDLDQRGEIDFDFPAESVRVIALDVDIILAFSDGAKILLPHFGLTLTGPNPPKLRFSGRNVRSSDLLSTITEVTQSDLTASISNIGEANKAEKDQQADAAGSNSSQAAPLIKLSAQRLDEPALGQSLMPPSLPQPIAISTPNAMARASVGSYAANLTGDGANLYSTTATSLTGSLYNIPDSRTEVNPNDPQGRIIYGGTGGVGSDKSTQYEAQAATRNITGTTDHNETVYLDDPQIAQSQSSARKLVVDLPTLKSGFVATKVLITDPPSGFVIMNGTKTPAGTLLDIDEGGATVTITLSYKLPADGASVNSYGYYSINRLSLQTQLLNESTGATDSQTNDLFLGIAKVQTGGPLSANIPGVPGTIYTLWTNPPGASVDLGGGDDVVYLSGGADTVTGGNGLDTLNYSRSNGAVSVDLAARTAKGGFAEGDLITDTFENIVGSVWADSLVGSSANNTISTGGNSDTVDGRDGIDTLDFTWSNLGVTLDLSSTKRQDVDGMADGMIVQNIENVLGSTTATNYLVGSNSNNLLQGGVNNDTFIGSAGLDTYIGSGGKDIVDFRTSTSAVSIVADDAGTGANATQHFEAINTLYGAKSASNYIAFGASITDAVIGGDLSDTISGLGGSGSIIAGLGNDSVFASGQYTVLGGSGTDTFVADSSTRALLDYSYATTSTGITFALGQATKAAVRVSDNDIDQVAGFQNIIATSGNDCLIASTGANYIDAGAGADTIIAGSANDATSNGNDTFIGGNNAGDMIDYTYVASTGLTITLGQTSFTTLTIGVNDVDIVSGFKSFRGGGGNDLIVGDTSDNTISGAGGFDSLVGGGQAGDWISYRYATSGVTVVFGPNRAEAGGATVSGTDQDSFIGFQNVLGSGYADSIVMDSLDNTVQAAAGNDTISGGLGNDSIDGGDGRDLISYSYLTSGMSFALSETESRFTISSNDIDRLVNVEGIIAGSGDDTLVGNSLNNVLIGGDGNDSFYATAGSDTYDGGSGLDLLSYLDPRFASVIIDMKGNSVVANLGDGSTKTDSIFNIERVIGTTGGDCIFGDDNDNSLFGNLGNDTIVAAYGNDTIDGGVGNDSLIGGPSVDAGRQDNDLFIGSTGNDGIDGGIGTNTLDYSALSSNLAASVSSSSSYTISKGTDGNDTVTSVSNIFGGSGNDSFAGDGGANWFLGGVGADTISGGGGNDTIGGGDQNDSLDGGDGYDYIDLSYVKAGITWAMSGTSVSLSPTDIDTIVNFENLRGGQGDDSLRGNAADNAIDGYLGKNTLAGGAGNDTLYGDSDDLVDYSDANNNITYKLGNTAFINSNTNDTDRIEGFGNIITGKGFDKIAGTAGNNYIDVGSGDDFVSADDGNDTVRGGSGVDTLIGGGQAGDLLDYSYVGSGAGGLSIAINGLNFVVAYVSLDDNDSVSGFNNIIGTDNNDTIFGDSGNNTLIGGAGRDCIRGGGGNDWLDGGGSAGDTIDYAYSATGVSFALGQKNTVSISLSDVDTVSGFENFNAGAGDDTVVTDSTANTVVLNAGRDLLYASLGGDSYDGGSDRDTINFSALSSGVSVDMTGAAPNYFSRNGNSWSAAGSFANFENFIGSAAADTIVLSGSTNFNIAGGGGNDCLLGGSGSDTIDGGAGADYMGKAGASVTNDVYYIDNANDSIIDGRGNDTAFVSQSDFTINGNVQVGTLVYFGTDRFGYLGGTSDVLVDASTATNASKLVGGSGNETLRGGSGSDSIDGGAGNDYIYAGVGNDTLRGGAGVNTLDYSYLDANTGVSLALNGNNVVTVFVGSNDIDNVDSFQNVIGGSGNDTFQGDGGANSISGGAGDDLILGSLGSDTIDGGSGNNIVRYIFDNTIYDVGFTNADKGYKVTITNRLTQQITNQLVLNAQIQGAVGTVSIDLAGNPTPTMLVGQAGDDTLYAGEGDDTIIGASGNDVIQGRGGNDSIDGNAGTNLLIYDYATVGISANLTTGKVSVTPTDIDTVVNIQNISGTNFNDTFVGKIGNNVIDGRGGNDVVSYEYVNDTTPLSIAIDESGTFTVTISGGDVDTLINIEGIIGGAGNDTIIGSTKDNMLGGGAGNNSLFANDGNDTIIGGTGNDIIDGGTGIDVVTYANLTATSIALTSSGSDITIAFYNGSSLIKTDILRNIEQFFATNNNETINAIALADGGPSISGAGGNDSIIGNDFSNALFGSGGMDTIRGGGGNDSIDGGNADGTDWVDYSYAGVGLNFTLNNTLPTSVTVLPGSDVDRLINIENIIGSDFADTLSGDSFANYIVGGGGNDCISGGGGKDTLDGGGGANAVDTLNYSYATAVSVTLKGSSFGYASVSSSDIDQIINFEIVVGSNGADTITGDSLANNLSGGFGNDCLFGGDGADTISGGSGADTLDGGSGVDLLDYSYQTSSLFGVSVNLTKGRASVSNGTDSDFLQNFENVLGSGGNDTIIGDDSTNAISSGAGADTVLAGGGNDTVAGNAGNDCLDGGAGSADWLDYSYLPSSVSVDMVAGRSSINGNIDNDTLSNFEAIRGGSGNDTIAGDDNDNTFVGGSGNDSIDGRGGNDWVRYDYLASGVGVSVQLNGSAAGRATVLGSENDTLLNIENIIGSDYRDTISGDSLANTLVGGGAEDSLSGGAGNDCLLGGTGNDTLSGGDGNDILDGGGIGQDVANYSYASAGLTLTLSGVATNLFTIVAGQDVDTLLNIEGLIGGSGNDSLTGDSLANYFGGGAGNDSFASSGGNDTFDGGSGNDIADYTWLGTGASLSGTGSDGNFTVSAYKNTGQLLSTDVLVNMESIVLSGIADLSGTSLNIGLIGSSGNDTLIGGSGANTFYGGAGNDRFDGRSAPTGSVDIADYSYATTGLSIALTGLMTNIITISTGTDVDTLLNIEGLVTGSGNDTLIGDSLANYLAGGAGNDSFSYSDGNDTLDGGSGSDTFNFGFDDFSNLKVNLTSSDNTVIATIMNGTKTVSVQTLVNFENITGLNGDIYLPTLTTGLPLSNPNAKYIVTGSGADTFIAAGNGQSINLGGGQDSLTYASLDGASKSLYITQLESDPTNTLISNFIRRGVTDVLSDTLVGVENFQLTSGADTLFWSSATTALGVIAGGGDDSIATGSGADTIQGGAGNDVIDGGAGVDTVDYSYITDPNTGIFYRNYSLKNNFSTISLVTVGVAEVDQIINVEVFIGGAGNDTLVSNGRWGTETDNLGLFGGAGNDSIRGGWGSNQTYDGGTGTDTLDFTDAVSGSVNINLLTGIWTDLTTTYQKANRVFNIENVIGTTGADSIIGSTGANSIAGGSGNDTISGNLGNDILDGGAGIDIADFSYLNDSATGATSGISITLSGLTTVTLPINISGVTDIDRLVNFEGVIGTQYADTVFGNNDSTSSDSIFGGAGNDCIQGLAGNDWIAGDAGNDTLDGGAGNDVADYRHLTAGQTVSVTASADLKSWTASGPNGEVDYLYNFESISSSAGAIALDFSASNLANNILLGSLRETVIGSGGNDTIVNPMLGAGANYYVDGSAGTDWFMITSGSGSNILLQMDSGGTSGTMKFTGNNSFMTFANIEYFQAHLLSSADTFVGSSNSTSIYFSAAAGNDILDDGSGNNMTLDGGTGSDIYYLRNQTTRIIDNPAAGDVDAVYTTLTSVDLSATNIGGGNSIDNLIYVDPTTSRFNGTNWSASTPGTFDFIGIGNALNNQIISGSGNDTLTGGAGNDTLDGGAGTDVANYATLTSGVSLNVSTFSGTTYQTANLGGGDYDVVRNIEGLITGSGNDTLVGDGKNNFLAGGGGDDLFIGDLGNDTIDGGTGSDTLDYSTRGTTINLSVALTGAIPTTIYVGASEYDRIVNIENIMGGAGADTLIGDANANSFAGGAGNDSLDGGGGNDALDGGAGNDTLLGRGSAFSLSGGSGDDWLDSGNGTLDGGSGNDVIVGVASANSLAGGDGNDCLFADGGNDTISGGIGNDTIDGGDGADLVDYSYLTTGLTFDLSKFKGSTYQTVTLATGDVDILRNIENLIGSNAADSIIGDSADNYLGGAGGNDTILAGGGADTMVGGFGDDSMDGGTGVDWIDYSSRTVGTDISVTLNTSVAVLSNVGATERDTIVNVENLIGGAGNDTFGGDTNANWLMGGGGANSLFGNDGNDTLTSGSSADTLDGGSGFDIADYSNVLTNLVISLVSFGSTSYATVTISTGDVDVVLVTIALWEIRTTIMSPVALEMTPSAKVELAPCLALATTLFLVGPVMIIMSPGSAMILLTAATALTWLVMAADPMR